MKCYAVQKDFESLEGKNFKRTEVNESQIPFVGDL